MQISMLTVWVATTCWVMAGSISAMVMASDGEQHFRGADSSELLAASSDSSPHILKQHHHQRPLRPALSTSERVIPFRLLDDSNSGHLPVRPPRRKQLRVSTLLATLGQRELDPTRMSVERPAVLVEGPDYEAASVAPTPEDAAALRALNLSGELGPLLPEAHLAKAEAWLLRKASCPTRYVWEDVGALFWPRWIKRGECVNDPRRSCSWPPGMHCVPAESAILYLLRWHCRPRSRRSTQVPAGTPGNGRDAGKHFRCQWLKVPYPVTDKCFCSC